MTPLQGGFQNSQIIKVKIDPKMDITIESLIVKIIYYENVDCFQLTNRNKML